MKILGPLLGLAFFFFAILPALARDEWFRALDLEAAAHQSNLLLVAEVIEIGQSVTVSGGKMETTTRQYKFKPVRVLKGVFARTELVMTSADLGLSESDSSAIERGRLHLLFLGRSRSGYASCYHGGSLDRSLPSLANAQDPLVATVLTLLEVANHHDRVARVSLLADHLGKIRGPAAVPLLLAMQRRTLIAAQMPSALPAVARHLEDPLSAVRATAATTLASLLHADYLQQPAVRDAALAALLAALSREDADATARVALLSALGPVGPRALQHAGTLPQLQKPNRTIAAEAARIESIGQLGVAAQRAALQTLFAQLPWDAQDAIPLALGAALTKLDAPTAAALFLTRARGKLSAGFGMEWELHLLGSLPAAQSVPVLLELFPLATRAGERQVYAEACRRICLQTPDARLVPSLSTLLNPRQSETRWPASEALILINQPAAARALQPHLRDEADLNRKLRFAAFLGRHGLRDGYPYAVEHLSEPQLLEDAVTALAAIGDLKVLPELTAIWKNSNDREWKTAALRALAAMGQKEIAPQLLEIVQDLRNPLAAPALIGLSDLGEAKALPAVRKALASRNAALAVAGGRAATKLLVPADHPPTRDDLQSLLADPEADADARMGALEALLKLNDARLDATLGGIARDARLEGGSLLFRAEDLLSKRKAKLALQ